MSEKIHDVHHLMMAALDGEIDEAGRAELQSRLAADDELRAEYGRLEHLKELTMMSKVQEPPREQWDTYWQSVYRRIERGVGWILVTLGALVLTSWGLWQAISSLLADTDLPLFIKLSLFSIGAGTLVLVFSVFREKLFTYRHDPFKEVDR